MIKTIYIASRTWRAATWRRLRDVDGWKITSSWIDEAGAGESENLDTLWSRIGAEIARSKRLILYVETEDFPLKGTLIEVGMAIAHHIPICIVAPGVVLNPVSFHPLGSWVRHPLVTFYDTLDEALKMSASTEPSLSSPPHEAPLLCDGCSRGCAGHPSRCGDLNCACPRRPQRQRELNHLRDRWTVLTRAGHIREDASLLSCALHVAANQFEQDARAFPDVPRTRQQFEFQTLACRVIAEVIE